MRLSVNIDHFATLREARLVMSPNRSLQHFWQSKQGQKELSAISEGTGATSKKGTYKCFVRRSKPNST